MSGEQGRRRFRFPGRPADPAWEYLARVPQDPEYPFHSLAWETWASRRELPLEEWTAVVEDTPDLLRAAERLARRARLCEREIAVFRCRVEGCTQQESARRLTLRKATVTALCRQIREKIAALSEESG
jgi:DNA-binding CsgD family transcriptional regulator